ncbi:MAG: hypothetical protein PHD76_03530 [Methylacidiphilales bacterium]|nr:hypothetical protein [Candidatus Methylacidiphilales bacterium]
MRLALLFDEEMNKTMPCPVSGGSIGIRALMIAPTPTKYRCPQCKKRLQLQGSKWSLKAIGLLYGAIVTAPISFVALGIAYNYFGVGAAFVFAIIAFILSLAACEVPISIYILNCRKLEKIEPAGHHEPSMK